MMTDHSRAVLVWWALLSVVGVLNVVAWTATAVLSARSPTYRHNRDSNRLRRWQIPLAAGFVFGCAFRSVLPRADVLRICMYDSWLSSVMVGRSVATIAELCVAAQWALVLWELGLEARMKWVRIVAKSIVPIIFIAELCSWYAVLTTNYIGNTIEESLWAASSVLMTVSAIAVWPRYKYFVRRFLGALIVSGAIYLSFMVTVDVPLYLNRWREDVARAKPYLSLTQGVRDASSRWVVTRRWEDWRSEIPWMSLYFSATVWLSISLIRAPRFAGQVRIDERARRRIPIRANLPVT